ncbi:MAG: class I SAM-dependent methyltransferase [Rhodospirillales bacterium]|nr:class I SAM-dependent methyltransferase [Rhodospirillales bacterium]
MTASMRPIGQDVLEYLRKVSLREADVLARLRHDTESMNEGGWAAAAEQSQFLGLLAQMLDASRILEVGTFTGYSTLAMAMTLPEDGEIVTCDMVVEYAEVGKPYWQEAGVADRIELKIGPAGETLDALIAERGTNYFDMAFIDANKKDYDTYYEQCLRLVRPGGLIALDNVLWNGRVIDKNDTAKSTIALRTLNEKLLNDQRISLSMLPINDGMTLCWIRA